MNIIKNKGYTLIELMIVVVIVGLLMAYAIPNYQRYVIKSKRTQAQSALLEIAAAEEKHNANYNTYTTVLAGTGTDGNSLGLGNADFLQQASFYNYAITSANGYTITATAKANTSQVDDNFGIDCTSISINALGQKTLLGCWQ